MLKYVEVCAFIEGTDKEINAWYSETGMSADILKLKRFLS